MDFARDESRLWDAQRADRCGTRTARYASRRRGRALVPHRVGSCGTGVSCFGIPGRRVGQAGTEPEDLQLHGACETERGGVEVVVPRRTDPIGLTPSDARTQEDQDLKVKVGLDLVRRNVYAQIRENNWTLSTVRVLPFDTNVVVVVVLGILRDVPCASGWESVSDVGNPPLPRGHPRVDSPGVHVRLTRVSFVRIHGRRRRRRGGVGNVHVALHSAHTLPFGNGSDASFSRRAGHAWILARLLRPVGPFPFIPIHSLSHSPIPFPLHRTNRWGVCGGGVRHRPRLAPL